MNVIYSKKNTDLKGGRLTYEVLKETFTDAIKIQKQLSKHSKKVAYFFIDPLINSFEAANQFYFNVFKCEAIVKINTYKSGASPIQALSDAKELIECGLYDAVFIFGYEPLLTNKKLYGKKKIAEAMSIFDEKSIIQCYNEMAHQLCNELGLREEEFVHLFDLLFMNYNKTYNKRHNSNVIYERGRKIDDLQADLFKLTDCANPNIDFAGGIILASDETASLLQVAKKGRVKVSGVSYSMVEGSPNKIDKIVGTKNTFFPHMKQSLLQAQHQSKIDVVREYKNSNLYLEVYTCYPPIPIAFLLTSGLIDHINDLSEMLQQYEITITGGMNLARAPWNNPALNGLIEMHQKLKENNASYGLVHGNGGIGETQGIAILERR